MTAKPPAACVRSVMRVEPWSLGLDVLQEQLWPSKAKRITLDATTLELAC